LIASSLRYLLTDKVTVVVFDNRQQLEQDSSERDCWIPATDVQVTVSGTVAGRTAEAQQ